MEKLGFVLIHGYSGSPRDLAPLAAHLSARFGSESLHTVCLPGHQKEAVPSFARERFLQAIAVSVELVMVQFRRMVLVGHSTGGILALDFLQQNPVRPALLVLAASPYGLDRHALTRWESHRAGRSPIALGNVARMVSHINHIIRKPPPQFSCAYRSGCARPSGLAL
jgi:pimeloyl-ACP methyl ester carboxylesterase